MHISLIFRGSKVIAQLTDKHFHSQMRLDILKIKETQDVELIPSVEQVALKEQEGQIRHLKEPVQF